MDEIITISNELSNLELTKVALNYDVRVSLILAFEYDNIARKKYLRSTAIMIKDELVTTNDADTTQLIEELILFDYGNEQNRYFSIEQHKNVKNLKLNNTKIYISKSQAKAICKMYNKGLAGYSLVRLMEYEYRFTPQSLATLLYHDNFLDIAPQKLLS